MEPVPEPGLRTVRSYVRREGRITRAQHRAVTDLLPRYQVPLTGELTSAAIFGQSHPLFLEIGSGNGETMLSFAAAHPDFRYVAVEVHRPGLGHLLNQLSAQALRNVAVSDTDIQPLLSRFAAASLAGAFIFFPDPWPKLRQQKRRLLQAPFLAALQRCLQRQARLYIATDDATYAAHIQEVLASTHDWFNLAGGTQTSTRYKPRPLTRFERRGIAAGHRVFDFVLTPNRGLAEG